MANKNRCEIRCYDYVNHPYERVRDALGSDAIRVFHLATKSAIDRARPVASELHVDFGGIGIKADVQVCIKNVEEKMDTISPPTTRLFLEWEATTAPRLFPFMKAEFSIYPITATETQLDFLGHYEPPFGVLGKTMNAVAGYRVADVSVHGFVNQVAAYLRQRLSSGPGRPQEHAAQQAMRLL